jgi:hypothetical protein
MSYGNVTVIIFKRLQAVKDHCGKTRDLAGSSLPWLWAFGRWDGSGQFEKRSVSGHAFRHANEQPLTGFLGLKPTRISNDLRGPEGPLFHGSAYIRAFFRKLWSDALIRIVDSRTAPLPVGRIMVEG